MKRITLLLGACTLVLISCSKEESVTIQDERTINIPSSCREYEEMKASGEVVLKEDHFATCKCPITCHFDDLQ